MTQQPQLTDLLTPEAHQRQIDRLTKQINPATPTLNREILKRIGWHTNEYLRKTGELPR